MTDAPLPGDMAAWPADPYRLLGVTPVTPPREVRAAYTRLIRFYKPEHYPQEFARLREAYEAVSASAPYTPAAPPPPKPLAEPAGPEDSAVVGWPFSLDDETARLWALAGAGGVEEAYPVLVGMADRHPGAAHLYARLYWLRRLDPRVDSTRRATDWLFTGLERTRLDAGLVQLLEAEVRRAPDPAWSDACAGLVNVSAAPAARAAFLGARWEGLVRGRDWETVRAEVLRVRSSLRTESEHAWLALVARVYDWAAWNRADSVAGPLRKVCAGELADLGHLATHEPYWFDRADTLRLTARDYADLYHDSPDHEAFCKVLREGWRRPFAEVRDDLERLLARIAGDPIRWLVVFGGRWRPPFAALSHFGNLLGQYAPVRPPAADLTARDGRRVRELFGHLGRMPWWAESLGGRVHYPTARVQLLHLCRREDVGPDVVAPHLTRWRVTACRWGETLPDAVAHDWPLHYVVWACRVFGG